MPPSKNASLLRSVFSEVDAIASRISKQEFPILLRPIAELRKVTSVDFCPLLVDAALITHPDGFRILLNSDGGRASELKERFNNESRERMMHPRWRFSIAHELAHTFFYDISKKRPQLAKTFTSGGGRAALDNLERNCNKIASHLLLPTAMFRKEFLRLKAITPETVLSFAQRAGVSLQALLIRLNQSDSLFVRRYYRGCIVLIKQYEGGTVIRAIAKPKSLNIAQQLSLMRAGDAWKLKTHDGSEISPFLLPPTSFATLDIVTAMSKSPKQYKLCVAEVGSFEGVSSFLITFEEN
ncbi:MAG TPA: ImmA/IrrE family metallo-endopeptidase [Pseudomonadales bacterium]|nr:ImmA/IrrE family metallo-endopeptidase [Pseudomonadales bacterium]